MEGQRRDDMREEGLQFKDKKMVRQLRDKGGEKRQSEGGWRLTNGPWKNLQKTLVVLRMETTFKMQTKKK